MDIKRLTLKNYFLVPNPSAGNPLLDIESLQGWLIRQRLHGKESRSRTRFIKLLSERITEIEEERRKLLKEHAETKKVKEGGKEIEKPIFQYTETDKKGNTITKETTDQPREGAFTYKLKDSDKFQEEYVKYLNEDYVLDVSPATREIIYGVRDLILNSEEEMSGVMAVRYNEICESFEGIK